MADKDSTTTEAATNNNDSNATMISDLTERLHFFFSNANLRQDKWMRNEMKQNGCITLEQLLKFHTIKSISTDKVLLAQAAAALKDEITYDEEKEELRRVVPFDWETMGDGSHLSLCCKNVPLTTTTEEEGDGEKKYAVTRDELKALFEPYGKVGIVKLRFGRRDGQAYPLGMAIIEFENAEGMEKASADLLSKEEEDGEAPPTKELEIKGNKLTFEKVKPMKCFQNKNSKRSRGDDGNDKDGRDDEDEIKFEPVKVEMIKGCVISLTGLSDETCDRESIREAVSDILKVTKDIKTSGLYVDYTRGETSGNLRLTESKPEEMKELVDKLNDGSILIANSKVGSAKVLEGEEEVAYWKGFEEFLNNRKRMALEEKKQKKKQKRFSHGRRR